MQFFPGFSQGIQLAEVSFEVFFNDRFNETLKEAGLLHNLNIFSSQKNSDTICKTIFFSIKAHLDYEDFI